MTAETKLDSAKFPAHVAARANGAARGPIIFRYYFDNEDYIPQPMELIAGSVACCKAIATKREPA